MYLDNELVFSNAQVITSSAASTSSIDLKAAYPDLGTGEDLYLVVRVAGVMNDSLNTDATCAVIAQGDSDSVFGSAATAMTIGTFSHGDVAGTQFIRKISPAEITERYLRLYYTVANGPFDTTSAITAFITKDIDKCYMQPSSTGSQLS